MRKRARDEERKIKAKRSQMRGWGWGYMCGGKQKNVWSIWMQGKKGKRIKNHNQMLPQYLYNISQ